MSHAIEMIGDKASMAYAGETPWHGLGKKVPHDLTPEQMLQAANLDWTVEKLPLNAYVKREGGGPLRVPTGKSALIRSTDNKCLDVVSDDWNPLQNQTAFEFFDNFVETGHMDMETAGSLEGGRIVWALARVHESFEAVKGDVVNSYLLFTNSHRYGKAIDIRFSPIRVVCNNTLQMALNGKQDLSFSVTHRTKFDPNVVKETMGIANVKLDGYREAAQFLASKKFTKDTLKEYINEVFPVLGKKDRDYSRSGAVVAECMDIQPGLEFGEGTWWQAFNGVTFAVDHRLGQNQDTRLRSAWYGANKQKKIEALQTAVKFAEAA